MDIKNHYISLHDRSGAVLQEMLGSEIALAELTVSHNHLLDYDRIKLAIASRPEADVVAAALKEYQFALIALSNGQYRHAFIGLRLFFELMLVTVQFSAHEIDYRMWARSTKDINWNALKDINSGVFSVNFINAFNPGFSENGKQYLAIAETVYRECSEFVHGNANTHTLLPADIVFHVETFTIWHQKAEAMHAAIVFSFAARYLGYIGKKEQQIVEPVILDVIGHLPAVQAKFADS